VLLMETGARLSTRVNRTRDNYVRIDTEGQKWREFSSRRYSLAPSEEVSIVGGIEVATTLAMKSDEAVQIAASNSPGEYLPAAKAMVLTGGSFNNVQAKNSSATATAMPLVTVID
jgi:hypothetical protein